MNNAEKRYEYYTKVDSCGADDSDDADCICWHIEGTGVYPDAKPTDVFGALGWREAPSVIEWKPQEERPEDGQHVAYRFEPFGTYHCGVYDSESDSVSGGSGFTSWIPEVTQWYPIPDAITKTNNI